nr:Chain C, NUCLEOPORIN NUP1 [Saccharomyces cerevisiae]4C31_F Chain F, NUCLEOPORIN NUP1 [Saccharomyces cerevisiae]4C31_X Chain X, NUCLEOPORIN NUP1 [Saccharomyces cerevisiae]4C31_Y Chain Y, NUCLEOPORIN NUP1 [Saccharomyces cerevisiae]
GSPKKDKESIVLPTVGFDFIKDNETPSKKTSPKATS